MDVFRDLCDKEVLRNAAIQELRKLGFKNILKQKRTRQKGEEDRKCGVRRRLFHVELHSLAHRIIALKSGVKTEVPSFVVEACEFIGENISTEGLFRKAGSNVRQKEIKASLEDGNGLTKEYHVIDVANTLKLFFRELPEPLIPFCYHEAFTRCLKMEDKVTECLLLCCLLLPLYHLNTLIYFTQFLRRVSDYCEKNKMDVMNLSIIMAPTLMPVEGRISQNMSVKGSQLSNHVKVIELLIKHSHVLGEIPENLMKRLPSFVDVSRVASRPGRSDAPDGVKKKRRSESMTRVLSGFRKMVRKPPTPKKSSSTESLDHSYSPFTPGKKRKTVQSTASFYAGKTYDVPMTVTPRSFLSKMARFSIPQDAMMSYPACASCSPKVCLHPNVSPAVCHHRGCSYGDDESNEELTKSIGKKKMEDPLPPSATKVKTSKSQLNPVRRWSSLASSARGSKVAKKLDIQQCGSTPRRDVCTSTKSLHVPSSGYDIQRSQSSGDCQNPCKTVNESEQQTLDEPPAKVHRGSFTMATFEEEYQEIKNKVSAIENQLMEEFGRLGATVDGNICPPGVSCAKKGNSDINSEQSKVLDSVQTKYEKTLEEAERFSDSSADQLAKRLSRDLKIRWSAEHKIIRSPSARKIGSLRRRSRESLKQQKVNASTDGGPQNSCNPSVANNSADFEVASRSGHNRANHSSLRRGRPNTVLTGLRHPSPGCNSDGGDIPLHLRSGKCVSSPQLNKQQEMAYAGSRISNISQSLTDMGVTCTTSELNEVRNGNTFDFHSPCFPQSSNLNYFNSTMTSTPGQLKRASSFQDQMEASRSDILRSTPQDLKKCESYDNVSRVNMSDPMFNASSGAAVTNWRPAAVFLSDPRLSEQPTTGRESVAKLRAQNAGKVLANVKLFEHNGRVRSEKTLSLAGASSTNINQNFNLRYKLNTNVNVVKNESNNNGDTLPSNYSASSSLPNNLKDRAKPRRSSSDSASHATRQGHLKRHGHGKRHHRKHRSFSPFRHKENIHGIYNNVSKENVMDPSLRLTENLNEYNHFKEAQNPRMDNVLSKLNHPSPLKDSNRILNRESPSCTPPVASLHGNGSHKYSKMEYDGKTPQTPCFDRSPLIKQPLTSGHASLRPINSLRKKTGKISPIKAIHVVSSDGTPKLPAKRQSPRLLLRSRLTSNACM
ncbi:uncharacterized protein LOC124168051 isoform X2 [Ischnura elegans]|uniref:uncharacterized protein LOC124168051 isoform X2 n=1 Tax=Ischnura elegans TaxID=197161 RepID=UPI001ED86660|nr:uncharacterized protein LOC124168051 isoform X2 [Ischnura elegans]